MFKRVSGARCAHRVPARSGRFRGVPRVRCYISATSEPALPRCVRWRRVEFARDEADTLYEGMTEKEPQVLTASVNVDKAVDTPTAIDEDELAKARLDERWREFCLNAERYVAETTRTKPRMEQPA